MKIAHAPGSDDYRKSSFSGQNTDCVEVRRDLAGARDSKNGAVLALPALPTFVAFIAGDKFQRPAV